MDGQSTKLCVYKIKYLYDMIKIQTTVDPYCDLFRLFHLLFLNTNFKVTFSALQLDATCGYMYSPIDRLSIINFNICGFQDQYML